MNRSVGHILHRCDRRHGRPPIVWIKYGRIHLCYPPSPGCFPAAGVELVPGLAIDIHEQSGRHGGL